jgi:hypothetical protein
LYEARLSKRDFNIEICPVWPNVFLFAFWIASLKEMKGGNVCDDVPPSTSSILTRRAPISPARRVAVAAILIGIQLLQKGNKIVRD